ncbi:MAG: NAD-dependent protein deacylase [Clostridia bacterium]|jgi:NAD-dependent deacetylase|nr:NAD-dependent protein deacylase [Clostridia bacterium]MBT7123202.1 NAD-dependent protein deacylase [Clostridia bacterium]
MTNIEKLQNIINAGRRIVFFGGAGVSTESGLKDFRSADGLYAQKFKYPPEKMLSRSFFDAHTDEFYSFYKEKLLVQGILPNAAHYKLSELEQAGKLSAVITQNIDGLHQAAGSRNVIELHGSVHRNHCMECGRFYDADYMMSSEGVPRCVCDGVIKPDVVMYEEALDEAVMQSAIKHMADADVLIVGGTSLVVYPAAGLVNYYNGDKLVLINKDATTLDDAAKLVIGEPIGKTLGKIAVAVQR